MEGRPLRQLSNTCFAFTLALHALACSKGREAVLELDHVYIVVPAGAANAVQALRRVGVVIDTEEARRSTGNPNKLAAAMRATCVRLAELDQAHAVRLIREIA